MKKFKLKVTKVKSLTIAKRLTPRGSSVDGFPTSFKTLPEFESRPELSTYKPTCAALHCVLYSTAATLMIFMIGAYKLKV